MTTHHKAGGKKGAKLPKAKAATLSDHDSNWYRVIVNDKSGPFEPRGLFQPVPKADFAVLPFATAKQAKAMARFHNLRPQDQLQTVQDILLRSHGDSLDCARAILALMGYPEATP